MGDVAMLVPVVASLAKCYPHLRITVLSQPFAQAFFEGLAPNVGFMAAAVKKEYKGIHGLNLLYRRLLAKHFTAVADMHDVLRTKYLRMKFSLDRYHVAHINKHRREKQQLCKKEGKQLRQLPTSFDNYAQVLQQLGYPITYDFHSIFDNNEASTAQLQQLRHLVGEKQSPWIGIAPFAAHQGKIYPVEKMEQTIDLLLQRHPDAHIFLFGGGKNEKAQFNLWRSRWQQCTNVAETLQGLQQELLLMSQLDVMLSMDSANMHLASLVATPVVSIWGATHPYAGFMGWGQQLSDALQTTLPCRPCSIYGNKPCHRGDYACLHQIAPETVVKKIETHLIYNKETGDKETGDGRQGDKETGDGRQGDKEIGDRRQGVILSSVSLTPVSRLQKK